ncbi:MAG: SufD family Fe-S cluster assembly protein [Lachnospiraceae bacterium]
MKLTHTNQLQMPTWRWLKMNEAEPVVGLAGNYNKTLQIQNGDKLQIDSQLPVIDHSQLPKDLRRNLVFTSKNASVGRTITIGENIKLEEPVILDFEMDDKNTALFDLIRINAKKGSEATLVLRYTSKSKRSCFHSGFTYLEVEAGAKIKLIMAQMLSPADRNAGAVAATVGEDAAAEVLLGELGSAQTTGSCNIELEGNLSHADLDGIYIGTGEQKQDFNYRIGFHGKDTEGNITVKGALAGNAKKVMKSTIDFITGASGAKGREEETVLTLSDRVVNLSAPLLLCGEDNVEGEHATSTGKPDEAKLYYLMSRGFSEKEARRLIVEASFTPLMRKVEPQPLQEEWREWIQGVMHSDA